MKNYLLVGLLMGRVEQAMAGLGIPADGVHAANTFDEARAVLGAHEICAVIMGAGIALDERLKIVRFAFEQSDRVCIHMKDRASGAEGFAPFVRQVIALYESGGS